MTMERFVAETDDYRSKSVHDLISLKGKTAVVTGGARGLGLAIAVACAELGANVALFDILEKPLETLGKLEKENGFKFQYHQVDVTSMGALRKAFTSVKETLGAVDCLVNAAGIGTGGPFTEHSEETIYKILAINLTGTIFATQVAAAQMLEHKRGGAIVNISSIGGHAGIPGQQNAVYCATKGGVLGFTKSLATEYSKSGIRVNSISPGFFLTKVTPGYLEQDVPRLKLFESLVPMGRFADRYELKSFVAFLLTDAASYITGEDIAVDGGVLAS